VCAGARIEATIDAVPRLGVLSSAEKVYRDCEMRRINRRRVGPPGEGVASATAQCVVRRGVTAQSTARTRPHRIMRSRRCGCCTFKFHHRSPHRFDVTQHHKARGAPGDRGAKVSGCFWTMHGWLYRVTHSVPCDATSRTLLVVRQCDKLRETSDITRVNFAETIKTRICNPS
jgi:hypothetical protein